MKNKFYVYIYLDPRKPGKYEYNNYSFEYEPFYVGKGSNNRWKSHLKLSSLKNNTYKNNKIRKILSEGHDLKKYITFIYCNSENESFELEIKLISLIGRFNNKSGPLTNISTGGDGNSGYNHTDEAKQIISEKNSGENNYMYGKTWDELYGKKRADELKALMSLNSKNRKGEKRTEETKNNISKSLKGKEKSEEHCKNLSITQKKIRKFMKFNLTCKWCKEKFVAKSGAARFCETCNIKIEKLIRMKVEITKSIPRSIESRKKLSEAHKGKPKSEKHRKKLSEKRKKQTWPCVCYKCKKNFQGGSHITNFCNACIEKEAIKLNCDFKSTRRRMNAQRRKILNNK